MMACNQIEKYLYKRADGIIAAQEFADKHVENQGGSDAHYAYISNAVDLNDCPDVENFTNKKKEKFIVTYIGAMGKANGVDEVLDAAKLVKNKNIEFHFMGDGPLLKQFLDRLKSENISNVLFHSPVAKKDVYKHITSADAFIVNIPNEKPYEYGLAHNKVFDYMVMGRPTIIATNTTHNPINEYNAGINVASNDAQGMANAADKLYMLSNKELEKMGQNARRGIEEKYNFENQGRLLDCALKTVLKKFKK